MAKYLVVGYDQEYGGLHGMEDWTCIDGSFDEAMELGREMAIEVIESYSTIMNDLKDQVLEKGFEEDTDEFEEALSQRVEDDVNFSIFQLRDDTPIYEMTRNPKLSWQEIKENYVEEEEND